jgi:IS30 family transposase
MKHLTVEQRYSIDALLQSGKTKKEIAKMLGKDKSTIGREIKRNRDGWSKKYKADLAVKKCAVRHRVKPKKIRFTEAIRKQVEDGLKEDMSPEQIVGLALRKEQEMVSHERIYQHLWRDKKQGGKLYEHLRNAGKRYRKRGSKKDRRGIIPNRVDIDQRPAIVAEKERFGDFEIDTVVGKSHNGFLVTINDRKTGLVKIKKVETKEAQSVANATIEVMMPYKELLHTITADNGKEFSMHQKISEALKISFYFAKPYHSWERGANENTNGLIRQYFPKKTDFSTITDQQVQYVENKLNNRPRKRHGFLTPIQLFNQTEKVAFIT